MKVFKMNNVIDWVAANSLKEAKEFYLDYCVTVCGMSMNEVYFENAEEEILMTSLNFVDENDNGTGVTIMSFKDQLKKYGGNKPYFFASTEH